MENIDDNGVFWLPSSPNEEFTGNLTYSPDDGCHLTLVQQLGTQWQETVTRILGVVRNKRVSLLDCTRFGEKHYSSGPSYNRYRAQHLFVGQSFVPEDEPSFTTAHAQYRNLPDWVNRTGFTITRNRTSDEATIRYNRPKGFSGSFSRGTVHIDFVWESSNKAHEQSIAEWPVLRIAYEIPTHFTQILRDLGHIEDLIVLCVDEPSPVISVKLQRPDLPQRNLAGEAFAGSQDPIEYFSEPIESISKLKPVNRHNMLIGLDGGGGIGTICKWLDNASDLGHVLGLLMTGRTTRSVYVENRYLNICTAAEAFHRLTLGGFQIPPERFEHLRALAIDSMPTGKDRKWIKGKLRYNEPTLSDRLLALAANVEPALDGLVADIPQWATTVAEVRNRLVHQDRPGAHGFNGSTLYWLGESVFSLTRASMLSHADAGKAVMIHIGASERTTWFRARLDAALTDGRELLNQRKPNL